MAKLTEDQIVEILKKSQAEWDHIHGNGWNEAYLTLVPTRRHLSAKRILEALDDPDADVG